MAKANLFWFLLLAWIAGIALGSFWPFDQAQVREISELWLSLALVPGLTLLAISWPGATTFDGGPAAKAKLSKVVTPGGPRYPRGVLVGLLMLLFVFGWLRLAGQLAEQTRLRYFADTSFATTLVGYIDTQPAISGEYQSFIFRVKQVKLNGGTRSELNERVQVTAGTYPVLQYGDQLALTGKLKTIDQASKIADWALKEQIFTSLFQPEVKTAGELPLGWSINTKLVFYRGVFKVKNIFLSGIKASLGEPNSAYVSGLLLGTKSALSKNWQEAFATVGLSHVLAVSGYNITIIAQSLMLALLYWLPRRRAFWCSFGLIIVFVIMTGATASVIRSAVMGILLLIGEVIGRIYHPRNAITFAAAVMLWFNPLILRYDVGFQLSFLATLGIFYITPLIQQVLKGSRPRTWRAKFAQTNWAGTLATTLGAQLAVLPLILFNFHTFSLASLPANLLVLPLVPLTMFFGFWAGIFGSWFGVLGQLFGLGAYLLSGFQLWVVKVFAAWQAGTFYLTLNTTWLVAIYLLGLVGIKLLWRKFKIAEQGL